ncbi:MAG: DUF883 family protein [Burkholderiaceae bacterium]|nr:DUF883 family protein [Burkholderiaceae bacterium]
MTEATKQQLATDVKAVLGDAEELLRQSAAATGEQALQLREKAMGLLRQAREKAHALQETALAKSKQAARATDDYVHENPWRSIGVAFSVGVVLGLLVNRAR